MLKFRRKYLRFVLLTSLCFIKLSSFAGELRNLW